MPPSHTVAILSNVYKEYHKVLVDTVAATLADAGYGSISLAGQQLCFDAGVDQNAMSANQIYDIAHSQVFSGIICLAGSIAYDVELSVLSGFLSQYALPTVSIGLPVSARHSVYIKETSGMRDLVEHLIKECDRKKFVFLKGFDSDPYTIRRESIFRDVLKEHKVALDEELVVTGNYDIYDSYQVINELIECGKKFDTVVCANDLMAISAARALNSNKLRIPQDVMVTGFDDTQEATKVSPALTTVRQPIVEMATSGTRMLIDAIQSGRRSDIDEVRHHTVSSKLIKRASTLLDYRIADALHYTRDDIWNTLKKGMAGLEMPEDCDLESIADAMYAISDQYRKGVLTDVISAGMQSDLSLHKNIHWWKSVCIQLDEIARECYENDRNHLLTKYHAEMLPIKEAIWSRRMEQEFEQQRLQEIRATVLLKISSAECLEDVLSSLMKWIGDSAIERLFLCLYTSPGQGIQPMSKLEFAYLDDKRDVCSSDEFNSMNLLPARYQHELYKGLLIMNPIYAGSTQIGYLLIDPRGVERPFGEKLAQSLAYALRGHYLLEQHEENARKMSEINQKLKSAAFSDSLTGLPNRAYFQKFLNQLCDPDEHGTKQPFVLMFIDLDGFKLVNDSLGHNAGDRLLCLVSKRLKSVATINSNESTNLTAVRLGGDEFVLVVQIDKAADYSQKIARDVLRSLSSTYTLSNESVRISASIGCARYPQNSTDPDLLVKQADKAMYQAKKNGKNCHVFYTNELSIHDSAELKMSHEIKHGLSANQFNMHYQPRIGVLTGEIVAAEALMRWRRKPVSAGLQSIVAPDVFIPLAEKTGTIFELDMHALDQAAQTLVCWLDSGLSIVMSINISIYSLSHEDCVDRIIKCLNDLGVEKSFVELEVTERGVMEDIDTYATRLSLLREEGIRIAIDDFGTGHSCLSYLNVLPADIIKIDKSFVANLSVDAANPRNSATILRSIVNLGKELDLTVVAEGVETKTQNDFMSSIHCDQVQGFYYSPAVTADEIVKLAGVRIKAA